MPFQFNQLARCRPPFWPFAFSALSPVAFSLALSLFALYRALCPAALYVCWCVLPVRLVFLSVPHAQACRKLRGTRDTTPDLCRSLCYLPRLHPSRRRCRASCWSRSIEVSCFTRRSAGRDKVAVVQRARGERAMAWIALRDQKSDGPGSPSRGSSLAPATVSPCRLEQFRRRHYRLAPGSDAAIGAATALRRTQTSTREWPRGRLIGRRLRRPSTHDGAARGLVL